MKDFHCRDAGMNCDWVGTGTSTEEVLKKAGEHAHRVHQLTLTPELADRVRSLIHDESSAAHQRSMAPR
jgi:predicted small metal-binding protein